VVQEKKIEARLVSYQSRAFEFFVYTFDNFEDIISKLLRQNEARTDNTFAQHKFGC
jgi:hypothetical protein